VTTPADVNGTGVEHRNRSVKVRIPAGVEDGQRIRVKGRGAAGRGNAPSGTSTWSSGSTATACSAAAAASHPVRPRLLPEATLERRSPCPRSPSR